MDAFDCYVCYLAMKRHFSDTEYDFIKYRGKVKASRSSFQNRRDMFMFEKLVKHKHVHQYLLANFVKRGPKVYVSDLVQDQESQRIYIEWKRRQESLSRSYKNELEHLIEPFDDNFKSKDGKHPHLLKVYFAGKISLETLIILNNMLDFFPRWCKYMRGDPIWEELWFKCVKYEPFLQYDKQKMKKITLDSVYE